MSNITDSRLETAFSCRASCVLPQADVRSTDADHGSAWHAHLERIVNLQAGGASLEEARDSSAAQAPETLREAMRSVPLEYHVDLDLHPDRCAVEVAFSYDVATGKARELGRGIGRNYGDLSPTEYAGTADHVQLLGDDGVKIRDYKCGMSRRAPAGQNKQLLKGALNACRAYGRTRAVVEIVRLDYDGTPWFDRADLSVVDLDGFAFDLEDLHKRIEKDRADYAVGLFPKATVHDGCRYCPSARFCPAQSNLARALVDPETDVSLVGGRTLVLDDDLVRRLIVALPIAEKRLEEIKRAVKMYASQTPIPLPDGQVYGPRPTVKREVADVQLAKTLLATRLGAEAAEAALSKPEMTIKGLEDARKAYFLAHPEEKKVRGAVAALDEEIEKLLHNAGALRKYDSPVVTTYRLKEK